MIVCEYGGDEIAMGGIGDGTLLLFMRVSEGGGLEVYASAGKCGIGIG